MGRLKESVRGKQSLTPDFPGDAVSSANLSSTRRRSIGKKGWYLWALSLSSIGFALTAGHSPGPPEVILAVAFAATILLLRIKPILRRGLMRLRRTGWALGPAFRRISATAPWLALGYGRPTTQSQPVRAVLAYELLIFIEASFLTSYSTPSLAVWFFSIWAPLGLLMGIRWSQFRLKMLLRFPRARADDSDSQLLKTLENLLTQVKTSSHLDKPARLDEKDTVSVILPFHNDAATLPRAIESVTSQCSSRWNLILVDDHSIDGSVAIAESYMSRFPHQIQIIGCDDRGAGAARNAGLENVRGQFVGFLDADDFLATNYVRVVLSVFQTKDVNAVIFGAYDSDVDSRIVSEMAWLVGSAKDQETHVLDISTGVDLFKLSPPMVWNKVFVTEKIRSSGLKFPSSELMIEDLPTTYPWLLECQKIAVINRPLYVHTSGGHSLSKIHFSNFDYLANALAELSRRIHHKLTPSGLESYHFFLIRQLAHGLETGGAPFAKGFNENWRGWASQNELSRTFAASLRQLVALSNRILRKDSPGPIGHKSSNGGNISRTPRGQNEAYFSGSHSATTLNLRSAIPDLTVIITVFREKIHLVNLISDLKSQDLSGVEILIIDDGSEDNTFEVVSKLVKASSGFRIVRQKNRGLGAARNLGISLMRGRYGVFLDADDQLNVDLLKDKVLSEMSSLELDFGMFQTHNFAAKGRLKDEVRRANEYFRKSDGVTETPCTGPALAQSLVDHGSYSVAAWQFIWDSKFLKKQGLFFREGFLMEDNFFTFQILNHGERGKFFRVSPHSRRIHKDSITQSAASCAILIGYLDAYLQFERANMGQRGGEQDWVGRVRSGLLWNIDDLVVAGRGKCIAEATARLLERQTYWPGRDSS
jgi:glycosyltransferase involved in cell wall biosynthesis